MEYLEHTPEGVLKKKAQRQDAFNIATQYNYQAYGVYQQQPMYQVVRGLDGVYYYQFVGYR